MTAIKQTFRKAFKIDDLEPHPQNPRRHDDTSLIEGSIEALGFFGAVLVQESRGRIIAGHGSVLAAAAQGRKTVPVILMDVDDDAALRILLMDNRSADLGTYDDRALADVLAGLAASSDLSGTGYTDDDVAAMLAGLADDDAPGWDGADVDDASADGYAGSGNRELVLAYTADRFDRVARLCQELRRKRGHDTNADLVEQLVTDAAVVDGLKLGDD